jgi:hypothetical protein
VATVPDVISPRRNPTGYLAGASAVYAAVTMIVNVLSGRGTFSAPVFLAAAGVLASLYVRTKVTPVAAPKDNAGNALVSAAPAITPAVIPQSSPVPAAVPVQVSGTVTILPAPATGQPPLLPPDPGTP